MAFARHCHQRCGEMRSKASLHLRDRIPANLMGGEYPPKSGGMTVGEETYRSSRCAGERPRRLTVGTGRTEGDQTIIADPEALEAVGFETRRRRWMIVAQQEMHLSAEHNLLASFHALRNQADGAEGLKA